MIDDEVVECEICRVWRKSFVPNEKRADSFRALF